MNFEFKFTLFYTNLIRVFNLGLDTKRLYLDTLTVQQIFNTVKVCNSHNFSYDIHHMIWILNQEFSFIRKF